ncbi:MAG: DEAD/DEAH box helicase [Mariprofundaceae bacterium]|nr:DEAD/DEAH box helicase [Mariprofundaceae bacterium]
MSHKLLTETMIDAAFDATTVRRGKQSVQLRCVGKIDDNDGVLSADVMDHHSTTYTVMVRWKQGKPVGNCSCDAGFNCKHVAALLLAQLESMAEITDKTISDVPDDIDDALQQISPFSMWLGKLDKAPRLPSRHATKTGQCIIYLLQQHPRHGIVLSFHLSSHLKRGGYGRMTPYQPANAMRQHCPAYMQAVDRQILRMAAEDHAASLRRYYVLHGEDDVMMLKQAISTTRCHWQNIESRALKTGKTLPGHWCWALNERGQQQLTLDADDADVLIIPLSPPWYVDQDRGLCGRIIPANTEDPVDVLLHLPVLEPNANDMARENIIAQLPVGIPLPQKLGYQMVQTHVRPVLILSSIPTPDIYHGILPDYVHVASLWLDYGEDHRRVYLPSEAATVRMINEYGIVDYRRDAAVEQNALLLLQQHGLYNDVLWLQQAPLKAHQFTLKESRLWPQWLVETLPALEQDSSLEVIMDPSFRHQLAEVDEWMLDTESSGWFGEAHLSVQLSDGEQLPLNNAIAAWVEDHPECLQPDALAVLANTPSVALNLSLGRVLSISGSMLSNVLHYMLDIFSGSKTPVKKLTTPQLLALRAALQQEHTQINIAPDIWLEKARALLHPEQWPIVATPAGLQAQLRDYQQDSLHWLQMLRQLGMHGILADDMGLGKTVQALAHILTEKESGRLRQPALVVCPTSLVHNWKNEVQRFTPTLSVLVLHGSERSQYFAAIPEHDIVITTYPLLMRDTEVLQSQPWHILILDEAQYIKNPDARSSRLVRSLKSQHRLCLTGTPMENHLGELWSLFDFLMPGYLSDKKSFRRVFRNPIEQDGDADKQQQLNMRIRPFILRRKKEDVATELPPKTEILRTVSMDPAQREVYEGVRLAMQKRIRDAISLSGANKSHIVLLDALMKMRQVCCDPRLLKKMPFPGKIPPSAKLDALRDMLPELLEEGRRILLFSQFTSMLALIEELVQELNIPYVKLIGSTRNRQALVDKFQEGNIPLFLISLKAGGTGLNLTAADTVIHYDPWWNPATEQQASDRAHRIGQEKPVFVYKLIAEGTVEEKILALQARKQALADNIHAAGEAGVGTLTTAEIHALFESVT